METLYNNICNTSLLQSIIKTENITIHRGGYNKRRAFIYFDLRTNSLSCILLFKISFPFCYDGLQKPWRICVLLS